LATHGWDGQGFGLGELGEPEQEQEQDEAVAQDGAAEELEGPSAEGDTGREAGLVEGTEHGVLVSWSSC
jgi:hypothetical protein